MGGDAIAPASMHILYIALRYKPNKPEKYPIYYVSLINIYDEFKIAQEFQYLELSLFIDSRTGLVLPTWFILALVY